MPNKEFFSWTSLNVIILTTNSKQQLGFVLLILAFLVVGLIFGFACGVRENTVVKTGNGAVVSNGEGCADIGGLMLQQGGSAVDAAIATLLCEGVVLPHSLGIGGGFVATIYTKATGKVEALIAREPAPAKAHRDMFINKEITGAIAAGVPTEIYGYYRLHSKYGKLPWRNLFEPTIYLCEHGIRVSKYLANVLELYKERILQEVSMTEIFLNPKTGQLYKEGEVMYRRQLGKTLRIIAEEGMQAMYRGGRIGKMLVQDIQQMGGIIEESDLRNYEVRWEKPINVNFSKGYRLYTTPLPTSGAVLVFILNVMEAMYTRNIHIYWQRLVETFKHAYGHRTNLGDLKYEPHVLETYQRLLDPEFAAQIRNLIYDDRTFNDYSYYGAHFANEEDGGTANIAVIAPNGDAITITSTINSHMGAKVRSRQTGIILNDEMDDFSTPGVVNTYGIPASPANFIKPGKIPMSSTCPSIILDQDNRVRLLVGGAGGSKITTSVAQTILRYFVLNESMFEAVNQGRLHHQLAPMQVDIEPSIPLQTTLYLSHTGHALNFLPLDKAFSALTAIGLKGEFPEAICDIRRQGSSIVVLK